MLAKLILSYKSLRALFLVVPDLTLFWLMAVVLLLIFCPFPRRHVNTDPYIFAIFSKSIDSASKTNINSDSK